MLMNHKSFHFTQIPDKTNDAIFLKSRKTLILDHFLTIFGHFCLMDFFPKNPAVTHNYIWAPKHNAKFPKKLMSQFQENLRTDGRIDRRTYGRMDGQTLFYRTLPAEARSPTTWQEFIINYSEKKIYGTNIV